MLSPIPITQDQRSAGLLLHLRRFGLPPEPKSKIRHCLRCKEVIHTGAESMGNKKAKYCTYCRRHTDHLNYLKFLIFLLVIITPGLTRAQGNLGSNSSPVVNRQGIPLGGVDIAVCQPVATTSASVTNNLATLIMAVNPQVYGYVAGMTIMISGFTGADSFLNAGTLTNGQIVGGQTILAVTSTSIVFTIGHIDTGTSSNGTVLQEGNGSYGCAGLSTVYSDPALTTPTTNPFTSDQLGNWNVFAASGIYDVQFYSPSTSPTVKIIGVSPTSLTGLPGLALNNLWTGNESHIGAETFANINKVILVGGNPANATYPATQAGLQAGINAAIANSGNTSGMVIVAPGSTISISSCTTDSESTYGILVGPGGGIKLLGYGAILNFTGSTTNCDLLAVRDSEMNSIEGFTLNGNGTAGLAGITIRRPSNANPGNTAQENRIIQNTVNAMSVGIKVGVAADTGQVSENYLAENTVVNSTVAGIQQASSTTDTNIYQHNTVVSVTPNNAILWDLECCSATLIAPVTGDQSTTGTIHYQFGPGMTNITMISPHPEVCQGGSSSCGDIAINWLSTDLDLTVEGGIISDSRTTGTSTLFAMNNASTGGQARFENTRVIRFGGTANLNVSGPTLCANGGEWQSVSLTPLASCVRSPAGNVDGFAFQVSTTGNYTWIAPDGPGQLPVVTSLTTTAATSDNVTIQGATSTSHCFLQPTNASADTLLTGTYVSAKTTNQITVTHAATAGATFDVGCTPN